MKVDYFLPATPETVRFGMFDAAFPPVLSVRPGERVRIECVSGIEQVMPPAGSGFTIPDNLARILAAKLERIGPHILTGPVAIEGAEPGDVLEVQINAIELGADWGYCAIRPLYGTLPEEFPEWSVNHIPIDRERNVCKPSFSPELPLAPFFGTMGVAPPKNYGRLSSREPREHGGNIDNKLLTAGSKLFLPVWVLGANFSVGDGHGRQGDGEVCINALEMALTGEFTFRLHKAGGLRFPRAETASHYISMGLNEDLDQAMKQALREMIAFIVDHTQMSRSDAYRFCSLAVDFRITQSVNGEKGVHALLEKGVLF